jgi:uncharacterized protein involved in response to NO
MSAATVWKMACKHLWLTWGTMREVWDGSLSYLFVGIGFVVVGLPSIKCVEPTLESWQGVQILFPDCLYISYPN